MSGEPRTWEQVLAAVEEEAVRAAELLAAPAEGAPPPHADPAILPAFTDMPPVPAHLRERVETLRERIAALQVELALALREWQFPMRPVPTPAAVAPSYLDRRV